MIPTLFLTQNLGDSEEISQSAACTQLILTGLLRAPHSWFNQWMSIFGVKKCLAVYTGLHPVVPRWWTCLWRYITWGVLVVSPLCGNAIRYIAVSSALTCWTALITPMIISALTFRDADSLLSALHMCKILEYWPRIQFCKHCMKYIPSDHWRYLIKHYLRKSSRCWTVAKKRNSLAVTVFNFLPFPFELKFPDMHLGYQFIYHHHYQQQQQHRKSRNSIQKTPSHSSDVRMLL